MTKKDEERKLTLAEARELALKILAMPPKEQAFALGLLDELEAKAERRQK